MIISRGKVARFHYTLKDEQDKLLESTQGSEPMAYLHGFRNIIDSLEEVLEGKQPGDIFTATIEARNRTGDSLDVQPDRTPVKYLSIEIEGLDVCDATPEETAHGHAHSMGSHHH